MIGCFTETGFRRIEGCCVLRPALREAPLAFLHTLDGYTLAIFWYRARLTRSLDLAPEMRPSPQFFDRRLLIPR